MHDSIVVNSYGEPGINFANYLEHFRPPAGEVISLLNRRETAS